MADLTRRKLLAAGVPAVAGSAVALHSAIPHKHPWEGEAHAAEHDHGGQANGNGAAHPDHGHAAFRDGRRWTTRRTASTRTGC